MGNKSNEDTETYKHHILATLSDDGTADTWYDGEVIDLFSVSNGYAVSRWHPPAVTCTSTWDSYPATRYCTVLFTTWKEKTLEQYQVVLFIDADNDQLDYVSAQPSSSRTTA